MALLCCVVFGAGRHHRVSCVGLVTGGYSSSQFTQGPSSPVSTRAVGESSLAKFFAPYSIVQLEVYTFANGANHFNNPVVYRATESNSNSGSSSSGSENDASGGTKAGDSRVSRNGGLEKKKKKSGETVMVEHVSEYLES